MTPRCGVSLVVAGALLLAGCGAGKPEDVAVKYVSTNAASKGALLTQRRVEQLTNGKGAAARATGRRNVVRFPAAKDVACAASRAAARTRVPNTSPRAASRRSPRSR